MEKQKVVFELYDTLEQKNKGNFIAQIEVQLAHIQRLGEEVEFTQDFEPEGVRGTYTVVEIKNTFIRKIIKNDEGKQISDHALLDTVFVSAVLGRKTSKSTAN